MSYSDNPIAHANYDWLGRVRAVRALQGFVHSESVITPLVVGVYGGWGTGKTSMIVRRQNEWDR